VRQVDYSGQFRKDVARIQKRGKDTEKLRAVISMLIDGTPLPPNYRDHALSGRWLGVRDAHIEPDWLLLYTVDRGGSAIRFERTGSHSDLFE
jgi:mRNA interferase YafQ